MSGICGAVGFGHRPSDASATPAGSSATTATTAMAGAMAATWGRHGVRRGELGAAAMAHALQCSTTEDRFTTMPVACHRRDVLFCAAGRLDNRGDLCRALGIHGAEAATMADSTVVLRAYEQWGERCVTRLFGDWSFAAWNGGEQRLFLARDHHGNTSLHYARHPTTGELLFASDPKALHAAGIRRRIDEMYVAQLLISWTAYHGPQTIDLDIARLPPAHTCVVTASGVHTERYWYPENNDELRLGSTEEYAEALLEVYSEAVRARCRSVGGVAITLSGGLDSGSVAALAAPVLAAQGTPAIAYTHVPETDPAAMVGPKRFGDERALASATARFVGLGCHRLLDSAHVSPVAGVRAALAMHDQPTHAASNAFWIHDMCATAVADGAAVLLTGQGGNATISWTGGGRPGLAGAVRERGLRGAAQYLQPPWVQRQRARRRSGSSQWPGTAINPAFAARTGLADASAATIGRDPTRPGPRTAPRERRLSVIQLGASRVGELWATTSAWHGIEVRDPTVDPRVIELVYRIPDAAFRGPGDADRVLIRMAMAGRLPDEVRLNRTRGRQSADLAGRLRACANEVEAALTEIERGPGAEVVSVDKMRRAWADARDNAGPLTTHRAGSILLRGMMAGLWVNAVAT